MDIDNLDWSLICCVIRARYKPLSAVAREVNSDWQVLNRLARGAPETKQPKFSVGVKLLDIYYDVTETG